MSKEEKSNVEKELREGKLPAASLRRAVLRQIGHRKSEVLSGSGFGLDASVTGKGKLEGEGDGESCAFLTTNPVSGLSADPGILVRCGIDRALNNLVAAGCHPVGVLLALLFPKGTAEPEVRSVMKTAEQTAAERNIEILGGHTEITSDVVRPVFTVTGYGTGAAADAAIHPGQDVLVTRSIGLEATYLLVLSRRQELRSRFSENFLDEAETFGQSLSVLPESRALLDAAEGKKLVMHDVSEGGIFGALWELCERGGVGLSADLRRIPIRQETVEICEFFDLNPYQILSGGSMLIASDDGEGTAETLREQGIPAVIIGRTTDEKSRILRNGEEIRYLDKPQQDELQKVLPL